MQTERRSEEREREPLRSILRAFADDDAEAPRTAPPGLEKRVRFQLPENHNDASPRALRTPEQRHAAQEARLERHERALLSAKQQMTAMACRMQRGDDQRHISEAVKRALTEPHFRLLLRVYDEGGQEQRVQYRPHDYRVGVRLLRALELMRRCGRESVQLQRQHTRLVEACLAPTMLSSRQIFFKLCDCEQVGEFVVPEAENEADSSFSILCLVE